MARTIDHSAMQFLYYELRPSSYSEKSFLQPPMNAPPIGARGAVADEYGSVTVLVTSLYNDAKRYEARVAEYAIHAAPGGKEVHRGKGTVPFRDDVKLEPGATYHIQPLTPNTQARLLPTDQTR
jgi:hypothetical protein